MVGLIILGIMTFFVVMEIKNAPTIKEFDNIEKKENNDEKQNDKRRSDNNEMLC